MHYLELCKSRGVHGGDVSSRYLLVSDTVWCCGRIPTFQRHILPASSLHPEDGGSMVSYHNTTLCFNRRPRIEIFRINLYSATWNI